MRRKSTAKRRPAEVVAEPEREPAAGPGEGAPGHLQLPLEPGEVRAPVPDSAGPELGSDAESAAGDLPADPVSRLAELRRRVLADGSDVETRRRLGQLLTARGELPLALEQYEAAREVKPEDPNLVLELAETLIALRRFDPAERELRRLLKFQPTNGAAYLQLGISNFRRGLYAQAELDLHRATELLPTVASAFFYRGEALNQLSRLDEAMAMLERTVELDPGNSRAYYLMGILYDKKNLPQEAAALYRRGREVGGR